MLKYLLLLTTFLPAASIAQIIQLDTLRANKTISVIDSLEYNQQTIKSIIVRKYIHNQTKVDLKYVYDTITYQLYKCQYIVKTDNPNDSAVNTTCFYVDSARFTAAILYTYRNRVKLNSDIAYFTSKEEKLTIYFPRSKMILSEEEIISQSKDLWSYWTSLKEWLRKKNGS